MTVLLGRVSTCGGGEGGGGKGALVVSRRRPGKDAQRGKEAGRRGARAKEGLAARGPEGEGHYGRGGQGVLPLPLRRTVLCKLISFQERRWPGGSAPWGQARRSPGGEGGPRYASPSHRPLEVDCISGERGLREPPRLQEAWLLGARRDDLRMPEQQLVERGGAALHLSQDEEVGKARGAGRAGEAALGVARVEAGLAGAAEPEVNQAALLLDVGRAAAGREGKGVGIAAGWSRRMRGCAES